MSIKIDITQIPPEGKTLTLECSPVELSLETDEIKFTKPIQIIVYLRKEINFVQIDGKVIGNLKLQCNRCLEDFTMDFSYNLNLQFPVRKDDISVDITEDLRQEIILNQPFKILCSADCKGLCPVCGKNLNRGECDCKNSNIKNQISK